MRHRIVSGIGIGNSEKEILTNNGKINQLFVDDAIDEYFIDEKGFDFQLDKDSIKIGIEPTYQYDRLKIITISKDKNTSKIETGKSWGPYGTQIAKNTKFYNEYRYKSKFVKFVDKWHSVLFGE